MNKRPPFALAAGCLFGAALALYWSGLRYPLVFDDIPLSGYALKTHYAEAVSRFGPRWLSDASFWWIHALFGKDFLWQRLANILLHAVTAVLLFGFLSRLFGALLEDPRSRWLALFAALWFLLHPVAVYGVAYLIERSIVLATLFSVLALWCVLEALLRGSRTWDALAAACFFLALFSKEHAVMVPAVAAALVILVRGASLEVARRLVGIFCVFAAGAAMVILQRRHVIATAYEPFASDILRASGAAQSGIDAALAYPLSVLNQASLFFRYLFTWLVPWPGWMSIDVRTPFPQQLLDWQHAAGFFAWLAYPLVAAWLLLKRGRLGLLGFGLLYPWLLALTEVAAVRVQEPFVLYRSYLWMSGLPAIFAPLLAPLVARWRFAAVAAASLALVIAAHDRLESFSSPLSLWDDAVRKNTDLRAPVVERAYIGRGLAHLEARRLEAARADFERAIELNPRSPDAHLARGTVLLRSAQLRAALEDVDRAVALDPGYAAAYNKRCVVKMGLGRATEALADCEKAVALDPRNGEAWINAGAVYRSLGRAADAATSYERALELVPDSPSAHYNYGVLMLDAGRRDGTVRRHIAMGCEAHIPDACDILRQMSP